MRCKFIINIKRNLPCSAFLFVSELGMLLDGFGATLPYRTFIVRTEKNIGLG